MPRIRFDKVHKAYGSTTVIGEFTADIPDNEFLVLLGPSGCGKSTMLRMIAGLTDITSGELTFDGERVNDLEPRERNVAFVFQSYALYPHMTVRENIAFPLIMDRFKGWYHIPLVNMVMRRRLAAMPEVADRVAQVAETLELTDYLDRRPKALSGGQRQRVAVARALVREPSVYLLDEPLSNLDAKLRTQMRSEITALYQRVGKTFIYVTHDQVEAMTMATRIVVLDRGEVQQIGTPAEIYERPANELVARFIGSPAMNLIPVTVQSGHARVDEHDRPTVMTGVALPDGTYHLGVRPEKVTVDPSRQDGLAAQVSAVERLGGETVVGFRFHDVSRDAVLSSEALRTTHFAKVPGQLPVSVGDRIGVEFDLSAATWFDPSTGVRIDREAAPATAT
ncbi:ABC transporter ATP-binding protein [uncultured Aeromicrobium sp.]|uniref:ABC transporter ATP-binding protein n=1 Tax=uncultured Aeromicrobium sp. TaxID=337820 RepID=UPI0025DBB288|nr:ABC transporter ATP-binding protein [uncultured Aeromicrobium sp.]